MADGHEASPGHSSHSSLDKRKTDTALSLRSESSASKDALPLDIPQDQKSNADSLSLSPSRRHLDGKTLVTFALDDPGNPVNWSPTWKAFVVFIGAVTVLNSTLGSTLPSGAIPYLAKLYNVTHKEELVLPNSIYLIGYVLGPLLFGPLSEQYGRWSVMLSTFAGFTIFAMGLAVAPNWPAFVIFRLIQGTCAASPISVVGGIYADIYKDATSRGRAMAIFMTATCWGPLVGPTASGFLAPFGERWPFWFGLIFAGVTWIPLVFLPETYAPILLTKRARKIRKADPSSEAYSEFELDPRSLREIFTVVLTRPVKMIFNEWIVSTTCIYLSLIYAILYMFFQAYPLIFLPIYGFNLGEEGLAFLPIGVGALFSCALYIYWDGALARAHARDAPWSRREEMRRLPLACIGGPFLSLSLFWIGWTARESVHWIVPVLGALPFGFGFVLIFMGFLNYLVDAYEIYAASAVAASTTARSLFGAALPFAAAPMYETLGVAWACTLLGILSLMMCVIPFAFIKYGDKIRANSKFCQQLLARKQKAEAEEQRERERTGNVSAEEAEQKV